MRKVLSCEFNIDTACVELCLEGGTLLSINCIDLEDKVAYNIYQRLELDWLLHNTPLEYVDLVLNSELQKYLKAVTQYKPVDS